MDTEGRMTRSRARTMATPLAAPLDAEPRRTVTKAAIEQLPRIALFDRTNIQAVQAKVQVTVEQGEKTADATVKAGTLPVDIKGPKLQDVPFEDNIVAQLLCEYQDTLEDEMRVTPARGQPTAPHVVETATDINNPPPAGKESLLVAEVERVEVQMLITPDRLEAVPTRAAKDAPEEDSAPEGVRIALIAQAAPAPAAEGSAETDDTAPASVTKIAPAPKEAGGERWTMDGTPNLKPVQAVALAPPAAVPATAARLKSAIKLTTSYDHRSLRQMKQDLKAAGVTKLAGLAGAPSETTSTACAGAVCGSVAAGAEEASSELCDALGSLHIAGPQAGKELLRGLPVPEGSHVRFDEAGEACATPSAHRTLLRGVPAPTGAHLRFD